MLTGLELIFMGVTRSNSGVFNSLGFIVPLVGKTERWGDKGRRQKGNRKWKEGRKNK